jgi:hypothetical protein
MALCEIKVQAKHFFVNINLLIKSTVKSKSIFMGWAVCGETFSNSLFFQQCSQCRLFDTSICVGLYRSRDTIELCR